MYCPSCDKSFGAVYSRCPECHSWLKVSAPAKSHVKSIGQASPDASYGGVSTLEKEQSFDVAQAPLKMTYGSKDSFPSAASSPQAWSESDFPSGFAARAPESAGASSSPDSSSGTASPWGASDWGAAKAPSADWGASPTPPKGVAVTYGDSGGWGSIAADANANVAPKPLAEENSPTFKVYDPEADDGWGAGALGGSTSSAPSETASLASSGSWLGGSSSADDPNKEDNKGGGWLSSESDQPKNEVKPSSASGWLSGEEPADPSNHLDSSLSYGHKSEADDFLDDSWVDEEVGLDDIEHSELPEYVPPAPEVGNLFLKMLLVAVMVIVIGGGFMFMNQDKLTPEQVKAQEMAKQLEFARSSLEKGKSTLAAGKPELALGPLKVAFDGFKSLGKHEEELWQVKVLMAQSLVKAKKYEEAMVQWAEIVKGPQKYRKEASSQLATIKGKLLAGVNAMIAEGNQFASNGESVSVLDLGKRALKILEENQGPARQKGKAYAILGRGYLNAGEYGNAKESFKNAIKYNSAGAGAYQAYLDQIASQLAPANYYAGSSYSSTQNSAPEPQAPKVVEASIDSGQDYKRYSGPIPSGGGRRAASQGSTESAPQPVANPRKREAAAFVRTQPRSSGGRLGDKGVVSSYNSR